MVRKVNPSYLNLEDRDTDGLVRVTFLIHYLVIVYSFVNRGEGEGRTGKGGK